MNEPSRILIVDDYAVVRSGLRALLEGEPGLTVIGEAENAETAVRLTAALRPDLIILDLQLPDFDGLEVVKAVRLRHPATRLFILSNHADAPRVRAALAAGAHGYWLKDNDVGPFIAAIRDVMSGRQMLHPLLVQA